MIKDIPFRKVEDIAVAVAPKKDNGNEVWMVYLINMKDQAITGVLVNSRGYGLKDGKHVTTSSLRQFFEKIDGQNYVALEILPDELVGIANQFWISFWQDGIMYDKKYVFVTESIVKDNFTTIPLLNERGVMIQ